MKLGEIIPSSEFCELCELYYGCVQQVQSSTRFLVNFGFATCVLEFNVSFLKPST